MNDWNMPADYYGEDGEPTPDADDAWEQAHDFDQAVDNELHRLRVRKAAQDALRRESQPPAPPFDAGTLAELLARPTDPPARVESLIPWEAGTLVPAMRKTGKTTWCLNLTHSLITGHDFLGRFGVRPIDGNVGILNYEVSGGMISRWAEDHGIDRHRLYIVNLRGRRNPLSHPEDRADLVDQLRAHDVESLIVDPFGRAYTGQSQNDSGEVGAWLADLDRFARSEVGARDLLLTAHAGWNGERTRGASALEDWADSIVTLTRDQDDDSQRFMRAIGRDVDLDEDRLDYNPTTRALTLAGVGSRKQAKETRNLTELSVLVVRAAYVTPGINVASMVKAIREMPDAPAFRDREVSHAARFAQAQGLLRIEAAGPGKPTRHFATETHPVPPRPNPVPGRTRTTPSTPSIGDGVRGAGVSEGQEPLDVDAPTEEAS